MSDGKINSEIESLLAELVTFGNDVTEGDIKKMETGPHHEVSIWSIEDQEELKHIGENIVPKSLTENEDGG
ncbi:MAG: hypothetical protein JXX14_01680 [Deltaproteobacteria bacterium]|nr:hypothetical protein [Deltaproteobacteria bacterium]